MYETPSQGDIFTTARQKAADARWIFAAIRGQMGIAETRLPAQNRRMVLIERRWSTR